MSIKARYCGSDTTALSDFTSISRIKRAVDSQTGMINLCRRQKRAHLFPGLQGKARPTVPSAETVWTTAINGNGQHHFQGDTRCILTFLFVLQGKYGQPSHPPRQSGRPPSTATANSIFKVTYVTIHCLSHYLFRSRRRRRQGKHDLLIVFSLSFLFTCCRESTANRPIRRDSVDDRHQRQWPTAFSR